MKTASHFQVQPGWRLVLSDLGIHPGDVLTLAGLPKDLFSRPDATLTPTEFFDLWRGLEQAASHLDLPLKLGEALSVEAFDAPVFASLCSKNLNEALGRLKEFKRLIGPMTLELSVAEESTSLSIRCYPVEGPIPRSLGLSEMVFFTRLAQLGTRMMVYPQKIYLSELPQDLTTYEDYFHCPLELGEVNRIVFSAQDANRPFLTENIGMWKFFEAGLKTRLSELDTQATTQQKVKSILMELLPSGKSSMEEAAAKLAVSKRTLQRRLSEEGTTFQNVLQTTREELAHHYLKHSPLTFGEISFLLAFKDVNSFTRAFNHWTGQTPGQARQNLLN